MFITLIVLFLGLTHAQHRCCGPAQWEANFGQLEGYYDENSHHTGLVTGVDVVHFDIINKRMVTKTNLQHNGVPFNGTIYNDYSKMKQYAMFGNNCTVTPIEFPMPSNCIPATANYTGSTYFGTGSSKLMLDIWHVEFDTFRLTLALTQNGCYPVSEGIIGDFGNSGTLTRCNKPGKCVEAIIAFGITAMTIGIQDISVFFLPDMCIHATQTHDPIEASSISGHLHEVRKRFA